MTTFICTYIQFYMWSSLANTNTLYGIGSCLGNYRKGPAGDFSCWLVEGQECQGRAGLSHPYKRIRLQTQKKRPVRTRLYIIFSCHLVSLGQLGSVIKAFGPNMCYSISRNILVGLEYMVSLGFLPVINEYYPSILIIGILDLSALRCFSCFFVLLLQKKDYQAGLQTSGGQPKIPQLY